MDSRAQTETGARHAIPIRRPGLEFDGSIPRHWAAGNALMSHIFNGLNLVFPDGERFFIKSVRDHLDRIEDEKLIAQVRGFAGQEGRHAHEHERYFEILEGQGFRIDTFLRRFRSFVDFMTRWLPAPVRLSITAGAEHYTAVFAGMALRDQKVEQSHPTMRKLIVWHATEEVEHKNVAFDVLRATSPSYALRMLGFLMATAILFTWAFFGARMLIRQDDVDPDELARCREELRLNAQQEFMKDVRGNVLAYLRRDFHPSHIEDIDLAHGRLAEVGIEVVPAA